MFSCALIFIEWLTTITIRFCMIYYYWICIKSFFDNMNTLFCSVHANSRIYIRVKLFSSETVFVNDFSKINASRENASIKSSMYIVRLPGVYVHILKSTYYEFCNGIYCVEWCYIKLLWHLIRTLWSVEVFADRPKTKHYSIKLAHCLNVWQNN